MLQFLLRILLSAGSGALVYASYAPTGWWPSAIAGIALLYVCLMPWGETTPRWLVGSLFAFAHSVVLYLLMLPWIGELVGAFPYVALAIWCSLYALLLGAGGVLVARWRYGFAAFPLLYLAVELLRSSVPFGGFSWVRLAWGQVEGPLAALIAWGGPALVTVGVAWIACGLVAALTGGPAHDSYRPLDATPSSGFGVRVAGIVAAVVPVVGALVAQGSVNNPEHTVGEVNVAAVQGNVPRLGLDFAAQRMAVLNNHVNVTKELAEAESDLDMVLWPENSSDVNPFRDITAGDLVREAVDAVDTPVMVGTLTVDQVGMRNTMQVFTPDGGVGDHHYKKYLQPFGETMPMREFFAKLSPYVERAGDFKPGDGSGVVRMGATVVGVATCYEVSFDNAFRTSIANGAQILTTPTNNATFGFSDMTYQQLAMSRMRAIETDRAVVVPATSGVSAIVHPDGTVSQHSEIFEPKYLVETLPLRDSTTVAMKIGFWLQAVLVAAGVLVTAYAFHVNRLPSRRHRVTTASSERH